MEDKICSVCRRQFSRRTNLTRHRKPLNNTGALSPVCKRPVPASRLDSLVRHLRNRHCYSSDEAKKLVRSIGKNNVTKQSVCLSTTAPFMHCTYSSSLSLSSSSSSFYSSSSSSSTSSAVISDAVSVVLSPSSAISSPSDVYCSFSSSSSSYSSSSSSALSSSISLYAATLKGKAILKENIIKIKDILFPNILVQAS